MKFSEAKTGRVFIIRLEHGDILHECIEKFSAENGIMSANLIFVGGADRGSRLVVGPEDGQAEEIKPMEHVLEATHEACGTGTLFPDEEGNPILHMHLACGRKTSTVTGCVRQGVKIWQVGEVILREITSSSAMRKMDERTGLKFLEP